MRAGLIALSYTCSQNSRTSVILKMAFLTKSPSYPSESFESFVNNSYRNESESGKSHAVRINSVKYSQVAQGDQFPKRNQGIVMDCIEGLNLTDYTCAVGDIVEPKNVIYSSRISNNRVCLYLKTKELVDAITDKYEFLVINSEYAAFIP